MTSAGPSLALSSPPPPTPARQSTKAVTTDWLRTRIGRVRDRRAVPVGGEDDGVAVILVVPGEVGRLAVGLRVVGKRILTEVRARAGAEVHAELANPGMAVRVSPGLRRAVDPFRVVAIVEDRE